MILKRKRYYNFITSYLYIFKVDKSDYQTKYFIIGNGAAE